MDLKIDLADLVPQEATLELSSRPGKKYILKAYTLRVQIWAAKRFGKEMLKEAFGAEADIGVLSEIAFEVLKDKSEFKTLEDFQDAVATYEDRNSLARAMYTTVGMSQPVLDKYTKKLEDQQAAEAGAEGNAPSPAAAPTGQPSTT
jgi:hypothetical protein